MNDLVWREALKGDVQVLTGVLVVSSECLTPWMYVVIIVTINSDEAIAVVVISFDSAWWFCGDNGKYEGDGDVDGVLLIIVMITMTMMMMMTSWQPLLLF